MNALKLIGSVGLDCGFKRPSIKRSAISKQSLSVTRRNMSQALPGDNTDNAQK